MRMTQVVAVTGMLTMSIGAVAADVIAKRWTKGSGVRVVAGFDLAKRGPVWEVAPCRIPNFAEKTSGGFLVGCDDSNVVMLDTQTGKILWRRDVAIMEPDEHKRDRRPFRETKVNRYHEERPEGFFVSASDEVYMLIGKKGEYLMRCDAQGCATNPKADREAK
jgi:hypothetical protein